MAELAIESYQFEPQVVMDRVADFMAEHSDVESFKTRAESALGLAARIRSDVANTFNGTGVSEAQLLAVLLSDAIEWRARLELGFKSLPPIKRNRKKSASRQAEVVAKQAHQQLSSTVSVYLKAAGGSQLTYDSLLSILNTARRVVKNPPPILEGIGTLDRLDLDRLLAGPDCIDDTATIQRVLGREALQTGVVGVELAA